LEVDHAAWAVLQDAVNVALLAPGYFGCYPIPGPDGSLETGRRLLNWVWYRNVAAGADFDELMTDRAGALRASSLAPGSVQGRFVEDLYAEAAGLPPAMAELVRRTARPFIQAVFDVQVPHMAVGRACLIGDAAFGGRPHLGAGTAKAAVDAWALADALAAHGFDVPAALAAWDAAQRPLGQDFVDRNRRLGESFQSQAGASTDDVELRPEWSGKLATASG
jgi:2,6-dihydroxypyridine 3-monooxygenase